MEMFKIAAAFALAVSLSACDTVNTMTEGFKTAKALESDLEQSTGSRPQVGFNWHNGRLVSVTVIFPGLYEKQPVHELADTVRVAVIKQFKRTPENIVLGFSLGKSAGTVAQAQSAH